MKKEQKFASDWIFFLIDPHLYIAALYNTQKSRDSLYILCYYVSYKFFFLFFLRKTIKNKNNIFLFKIEM